jgi:type I restriction enzyme, S subunit
MECQVKSLLRAKNNPYSFSRKGVEDIEKDTSTVLTKFTVADRDSRSTKSEFQVGDILYGKLRPYLNKVLVATEPGYSTTEIVAIRSFIPLCSNYCCLAFRRPDFVDYVNRVGQGTKMPRLRTLDALVALFPLPPLAEQHRIVAKVGELMDLCDRLEAAQKNRENLRDRLVAASLHQLNQAADSNEEFFDRARFYFDNLAKLSVRSEHIKQLRQTILNFAVSGKLVPQNSSDETALELLQQVKAEKTKLIKDGTIPNQKISLLNNSIKLTFDCPVSWEKINFSDVCNLVTSGSRGWAEYYSNTGSKFIRAQNIRFGKLKLDDIAHVKLPKKTEGIRTQLSQGDILIVITGAGVTNPALLDTEIGEAYVSQHVALVKSTKKELSQWLLLCLMAPIGGRNELVERAYGSGKPGLNLDNIRSLKIALPPLNEQNRIIAKVDELILPSRYKIIELSYKCD